MNVAIAILLAISLASPNPHRQTRAVSYRTCHCKKCQQLRAAAPDTANSAASSEPGATNDALADRLRAMILKYNRQLKPEEAEGVTRWIEHYSAESGIDAALVAAVIARESSFNPEAVSSTGAAGFGQLTAGAAKDVGVVDALDPEENVRGTAAYLARLFGLWKDRSDQMECTVASYVIGHRVVKKNNGVPPDEATRKFVDEVMANYHALADSAK